MSSAAPSPTPEAQRLLDDCVRVRVQQSLSSDLDDATTVSQDDDAMGGTTDDFDGEMPTTTPTCLQMTERRGWLYRFVTPVDDLLLGVGLLTAVASGAVVGWAPCVVVDALAALSATSVDTSAVLAASRRLLWMACGAFALRVVSAAALDAAASRQIRRLYGETVRRAVCQSVPIPDERAWLVGVDSTSSVERLHRGIGRALGDLVRVAAQAAVALVVIVCVKGSSFGVLLVIAIMPAMQTAFLGALLYALCLLASRIDTPTGPDYVASRDEYWRADDWQTLKQTVITNMLGQMRTVAALNAQEKCIAVAKALWREDETKAIGASNYWFVIVACALAQVWFMVNLGLSLNESKVPANHLSVALAWAIAIGSIGQAVLAYMKVNDAREFVKSAFGPILDSDTLVKSSSNQDLVLKNCRGAIAFKDVSCKDHNPQLKDFTLSIAAGSKVAVLRANGAHRSPLFALLMQRLIHQQSGEITLDDQDIEDLNLHWLREQIVVVEPDPVLFGSLTVYETIAAGGRGIMRAQVMAAAKKVNIHELVLSLSRGYDTLVSATSLTREHRQLLVIARAIAREPTILILDHAFDRSGTLAVRTALEELVGSSAATTLVLTNQFSFCGQVDQIVVVKDGRVIESGSHDELIQTDGVYKARHNRGDQEVVSAEDQDVPKNPATSQPLETQRSISLRAWAKLVFAPPHHKLAWLGVFAALTTGFVIVWILMLLSDLGSSMLHQYAALQASPNSEGIQAILSENESNTFSYFTCAIVVALLGFCTHYAFASRKAKAVSSALEQQLRVLTRRDIAYFDARPVLSNVPNLLYATADRASKALGALPAAISVCVSAALAAIVGASVSSGDPALGVSVLIVSVYTAVVDHIVQRPTPGISSTKLSEDALEFFQYPHSVASLGSTSRAAVTCCEHVGTTLDRLHNNMRTRTRCTAVVSAFDALITLGSYAIIVWYSVALGLSVGMLSRTLMFFSVALLASCVCGLLIEQYLQNVMEAQNAEHVIQTLEDRPVKIDATSDKGLRLDKIKGAIEFRDVTFCDPIQSDASQGLRHFSAKIEAGETVAFCGPPDGGHSSIVALLERFYDPVEGEVLVDGVDVKTLHVGSLRRAIGVVDRAPKLFQGGRYAHQLSVADNLTFGLVPPPPQRKIETACKLANAHDLIMRSTEKYETKVKDASYNSRLVALARAIIRNPSVLVLDNVASDRVGWTDKILDDGVEKVLASKKRTTILIGHQLSAVQRADKIFVLDDGRVVEQGTHEELLAVEGVYAKLVGSAT